MTKLILTAVLTLVSFSNAANACMGGNLLQVTAKRDTLAAAKGTVIANYNIVTGKQVATNRSFKIVSVERYASEEEYQSEAVESLCKKKNCSELKQFEKTDIRVTFKNVLKGRQASVIIKGISIDRNQPIAKAIPRPGEPPVQMGEFDELDLISCSKK